MTREERELSIEYLESIKDNYIEGHGYERHPLPEYYAIENAIKVLEQEDILDKIRAEIERMTPTFHNPDWSITDLVSVSEVLNVIDKYKGDKEET